MTEIPDAIGDEYRAQRVFEHLQTAQRQEIDVQLTQARLGLTDDAEYERIEPPEGEEGAVTVTTYGEKRIELVEAQRRVVEANPELMDRVRALAAQAAPS